MKLGIIGAMDVEVAHLKDRLEGVALTRHAAMDFCEGTLAGVRVVVVKCGVGKVNAAVCAEALAALFGVTHVINTGIAGCLNDELDIGDVIVSTDAVQHDMDVTRLGYPSGEVPGLGVATFAADEALVACALEAARSLVPPVRALAGRVASGDQFVGDAAVKKRVKELFGADCCEMEGAGIAQACWLNGLPFVIIRAMSDRADGSSHVDYPSFERRAAQRCALITEGMVRLLAQGRTGR